MKMDIKSEYLIVKRTYGILISYLDDDYRVQNFEP